MASMLDACRLNQGLPAKLSSGVRANTDLSKRGADLTAGPNTQPKLKAAAWSNTWPAPGATLDLDFANDRGFVRGVGSGKSMDAVTFTRASSGNWVDSTGVMRTGAGTFQGTANATATNLLANPQNFESSSWTKENATITANVICAPDGTITGSKCFATASTSKHDIYNSATATANSYTVSYYAKAAEYGFSYLQIATDSAAKRYTVVVDLSNGNVTSTASLGSPVNVTSSVTNIGNGWFRIQVKADNTSGLVYIVLGPSKNGTPTYDIDKYPSYTGDNASGIYIWGAQLEPGSSATTYYPTNINAPRFDWASTAVTANTNLLNNSNIFSSWGIGSDSTKVVVTPNSGTSPDGTNNATLIVPNTTSALHRIYNTTTVGSGTFTFSIYAKPSGYPRIGLSVYDGSAYQIQCTFDVNAGTVISAVAGSASITSIGGGWYRCIATGTSASGNMGATAGWLVESLPDTASARGTFTGDGSSGSLIYGAQVASGSAALTYQAIGQQVPTNTPLAATTCNGLLIEESRTNRLLWCRDASQTNWVKTNVTPLKNQTGIDGVANAASSLTASADGGTCIQTVTLASGSRTGSVYLKRITGTGTIQVSLDGSTWSTVDLSNGLWNRIVLSGTVTNPVVGIKIATNGDAVAMDYGQIEDGAFVTTPILTTTATVTRAVDAASIGQIPINAIFPNGPMQISVAYAPSKISGSCEVFSFQSYTSSWALYLQLYAGFQPTFGGLSGKYNIPSAYSKTITSMSINDSTIKIDSNGALPQETGTSIRNSRFTNLVIGFGLDGQFSGYISRFKFTPQSVSLSALLTLSSGTT